MNIKQTLYAQSFAFQKGGVESDPLFTKGGKPAFIGFPTSPDGAIALSSSQLTVEGSFDGTHWFTVNDFTGVPVKIMVRAAQEVIPAPSSVETSPAILPVRDGLFAEGIQMIRFRGNRPEEDLRKCQLFREQSG